MDPRRPLPAANDRTSTVLTHNAHRRFIDRIRLIENGQGIRRLNLQANSSKQAAHTRPIKDPAGKVAKVHSLEPIAAPVATTRG